MANGNFGGGDGTKGSPYLVEDAQDLSNVRNNEEAHYKQIADIDLSGINWESMSIINGSYNGGFYTISNLRSINRKMNGLFEVVSNSTIKNVKINNAYIENNLPTCYVGIVAVIVHTGSTLINCHTKDVTIRSNHSTYPNIGGIVSHLMNSRMSKCMSINIDVSGGTFGGLVSNGYKAYISNCCVTGHYLGTLEVYNTIDDFVMYSVATTLKNCYSSVSFDSKMSNPYNEGVLTRHGNSEGYEVNSVYVDYEDGSIQQAWSSRLRYPEDFVVNGSDGRPYRCIEYQSNEKYHYQPNGSPIVLPFYEAEPIIGSEWGSYWKLLYDDSVLKTHLELKDMSAYIGWDFKNVWQINPSANKGLPTLREVDLDINVFAKIDNVWARVVKLYAKNNGTWKESVKLFAKNNNEWE